MGILIPLLILGAVFPASAGSRTGAILLPVAGPTPVRMAYNAGIEVPSVGAVFKIGPGADGKIYTLTKTGGFGNLDAYFYTDDNGSIGELCNPIPPETDPVNPTVESGSICPSPLETVGWAIVVLRWGFDTSFALTW